MYNIYYIGAQNSERIDFCQWPYMVTGGDLFDGEFDAIEDDDRIQGWERKSPVKAKYRNTCSWSVIGASY